MCGKWETSDDIAPGHPKGGHFEIAGIRLPITICDTHEGEPECDDSIALLADQVERVQPPIVCGFVTSQAASEFLGFLRGRLYGNKRVCWPAVILPMATSSDILRRDHNKDEDNPLPIIRLVANNQEQVNAISQCVVEIDKQSARTGKNTVAIFRDGENIAYARNLADAFRIEVESRGIAVILDSVFGSDRGSVDLSLLLHKPEYIVFFGMLNSAIPLVRQVQRFVAFSNQTPFGLRAEESEEWHPQIFVSDGSCRESLWDLIARPNELNGIQGFFPANKTNLETTHPLAAVPWNGWLNAPSFFEVGHDTAVLIAHLLYDVAKERQQPDSEQLAAALCRLSLASRTHDYSYVDNERLLLQRYRFDKYGDVMGKSYETWKLQDGRWQR